MPSYPQSEIIRNLFMRGQPLAFGKGELILGNDSEPNGVYYISSGFVKAYTLSDEGDEYIHLIYGHGELFPIIWAYIGIEPDSLFYETLSDCSVWRISRGWFNEFMRNNLNVCYAFSLQLAYQFNIFAGRLDNLEYKRARDRVVYRLLFLASRFGTQEGNEIHLDMPITHEVFANSVNLARESVSRHMEALERQGLVRQAGHTLIITDKNRLAAMLSRPGNLRNWRI